MPRTDRRIARPVRWLVRRRLRRSGKRLLKIAEIVLLAREHLAKLEPYERRRILELVRIGRGRAGNLTAEQREELAALLSKVEPRLLVGRAAEKLSPIRLPERVVRGPAQH